MPAKTASWRRRSEPPYRRPTMTPPMSPKHPTPPAQRTNQTRSLSRTARDPSPLMAQTVKHQRRTKTKVPQANARQTRCSPAPSRVYIRIAPLPPTKNLPTKRTITVTKRRRAKRTTWSLQPEVRFMLRLKLIPEGITAPPKPKLLEPPTSAPRLVKRTVLTTMVQKDTHFRGLFQNYKTI